MPELALASTWRQSARPWRQSARPWRQSARLGVNPYALGVNLGALGINLCPLSTSTTATSSSRPPHPPPRLPPHLPPPSAARCTADQPLALFSPSPACLPLKLRRELAAAPPPLVALCLLLELHSASATGSFPRRPLPLESRRASATATCRPLSCTAQPFACLPLLEPRSALTVIRPVFVTATRLELHGPSTAASSSPSPACRSPSCVAHPHPPVITAACLPVSRAAL